MTNTEQIASLIAKNNILQDEMIINAHIANNEIDSLTKDLGEAVETIYNNDMEVIDNV